MLVGPAKQLTHEFLHQVILQAWILNTNDSHHVPLELMSFVEALVTKLSDVHKLCRRVPEVGPGRHTAFYRFGSGV